MVHGYKVFKLFYKVVHNHITRMHAVVMRLGAMLRVTCSLLHERIIEGALNASGSEK